MLTFHPQVLLQLTIVKGLYVSNLSYVSVIILYTLFCDFSPFHLSGKILLC